MRTKRFTSEVDRKHFYVSGLLKVTNNKLEPDQEGKQELEVKRAFCSVEGRTVLRHRTSLQHKT